MSDQETAGPGPDAGIVVETNATPEPSNDSANAPSAAEPVESADDEADNQSDQGPERRKNGRVRQLESLRSVISDKERIIAELQKQLSGNKPESAPQEQKPSAPAEGDDPEPKIEDYKDVTEWVDARAKWFAKQAVKDFAASQKEAEAKAKADQARQAKIDTYDKRVETLLETVPDFYERVQDVASKGQITQSIEDAVLDSQMPELVTLHLLSNPVDLQIMQGMSDKDAAVAVARIEAYIQANSQSPQSEPTVAKPTKAAAPITPIGKKASTSNKDPSDMSQSEYEAYAAKLKGRR